jgi:ribosomal protein S18 acetylase RimI-like enzyme
MHEEDVPAVAVLYEDANPHTTAARIAEWTTRIVREYGDLAIVLERDASILGAASGDVNTEGHGVLQDIAVLSTHRRRGHGTRLLVEMLSRYRARGLRRVCLEVHYRNAAAVPFYYRHGFRVVKVLGSEYGPGQDALRLAQDL